MCYYQDKTFFYVFFPLLISCPSFQMNVSPPKMLFKIVTGWVHKITNHRISQSSLYFYAFEVVNLSERKHLVFSDHDFVLFRCEIQIFVLNILCLYL